MNEANTAICTLVRCFSFVGSDKRGRGALSEVKLGRIGRSSRVGENEFVDVGTSATRPAKLFPYNRRLTHKYQVIIYVVSKPAFLWY